eukprot:scaffold330530_cov45-Tisochrysis_lutea.AAC.1
MPAGAAAAKFGWCGPGLGGHAWWAPRTQAVRSYPDTQGLWVNRLASFRMRCCARAVYCSILTERLLLVWASWTLFRASWASTSPRCGHAAPAFK